jgi:two-component system LytT family response regulator
MNLRIVTLDDEPLALRRLRHLLSEHSDVLLAAECTSGASAINAVHKHRPNLLILDINMPEMSGFELVAELRKLSLDPFPELIFKTAHPHFSLRAFEFAALDYLLKPTSRERLNESLNRARVRLKILAEGGSAPEENSWIRRIPVRKAERTLFIETERIHWLEAASNYVVIHAEGAREIVRDTLGSFENKLCPKEFARISRAAIVRLSSINEISTSLQGDHFAILKTGEKLHITRSIKHLSHRLSEGS